MSAILEPLVSGERLSYPLCDSRSLPILPSNPVDSHRVQGIDDRLAELPFGGLVFADIIRRERLKSSADHTPTA